MEKITLSYGSGGKLTHRLINELLIKKLKNPVLGKKEDSAVIRIGPKKLAFTTDSYVVNPIFFPGGDIGSLAVYGTVNDISVCGAKPLYISLGLIIEEGLDKDILEMIVKSIKDASRKAGVKVVTGDTKVVEKGFCDKIFINTSGIGEVYYEGLSINNIKPGDAVIVNGPIGEHAISVLSKRKELSFKTKVLSDCAPLNKLIHKILRVSGKVRFARDPTRGGVATTLNEITKDRHFGISIEERSIPVGRGVREACELLGFDPLYLACEGRVVIIVDRKDEEKVLRIMRQDNLGKGAMIIGKVTGKYAGRVCLNTAIGGKRIVDMMTGEQLPRIC